MNEETNQSAEAAELDSAKKPGAAPTTGELSDKDLEDAAGGALVRQPIDKSQRHDKKLTG